MLEDRPVGDDARRRRQSPAVRGRESDAEGAYVHVEDDAPRIPATEWTTELFGGDLDFSGSDPGGNDVRMRLPRR